VNFIIGRLNRLKTPAVGRRDGFLVLQRHVDRPDAGLRLQRWPSFASGDLAEAQHVLGGLHPIFRKRCERDGLDDTSSWLAEEDLEADTGDPVPLEQPAVDCRLFVLVL
jgi:hypothetical protein